MAGTVVVYAEERSLVEANAPTFDAVARALQGVTMQPGGWVGPAARITRVVTAPYRLTRIARPWRWETAHTAESVRPALEDWVRTELAASAPGDWTVATFPYTEALNGSIAWWQSGQAAVTQTRDQFSLIDSDENPIGPTTPETRPTTPGDILNNAGRGAESAVNTLVAGSVGLGLVYALTQLVAQWNERRRRRAAQ